MGTREGIARGVLEGTKAAEKDDPPTTCPYPRTSVLRTAWVRGYAGARPATAPDE